MNKEFINFKHKLELEAIERERQYKPHSKSRLNIENIKNLKLSELKQYGIEPRDKINEEYFGLKLEDDSRRTFSNDEVWVNY